MHEQEDHRLVLDGGITRSRRGTCRQQVWKRQAAQRQPSDTQKVAATVTAIRFEER
jgi:hypothetical protein